jgi:UNC-50 family
MTSGGGVPHVRKTTSRAGSSNLNHSSLSSDTAGGSNNVMDALSIEQGNSEPSITTTGGNSTMSHTNMTAPHQIPSGTVGSSSAHHPNPSLLQQPHPPSSLRSSSSLYQNHHHYASSTMDWYRFYDVRSMDIQSALDQMKTLLSVWNHNNSSNKSQTMMIYKLAYYRKQTKNHWYRDDPTFILLQILMLFISCITYSIAFKISILHAISFIMTSILFNYLFVGIVVTSILREFTNRHLLTHHHHTTSNSTSSSAAATSTHIQKQQVEWLYAFDIHCNSFFPFFIVLCTYFLLIAVVWWIAPWDIIIFLHI